MLTRLVICLFCAFWLAMPAAAAKRVALIIGNSNYVHFSALANPRNDAKAIAEALRVSKFDDVTLVQDLDRTALNRALQTFSSKSVGAEIALVYYAGHGVEVNGVNYLVPIDAELQRSTDVAYEAIPLDLARNSVAPAAMLRMVILDACRNNPFKLADVGSVRAARRGLRAVEADASEFIAYSAKEGTTAQDGPPDGNSPFAVALANAIKQPGLEIRLMFGKVRDDVIKATNKEQEPFTYTSLGGESVFLNPPKEEPIVEPPPAMLAINMAWAEVKTSKSKAVIQGFKQQYNADPNFAVFGALADELLLTLSAKTEVAPPPEKLKKAEVQVAALPTPEPVAVLPPILDPVVPKSEVAPPTEKPKKAEIQVAALPALEPIAVAPPKLDPSVPKIEVPPEPDRDLVLSLKKELKRLGCYNGKNDGTWNKSSQAALSRYNKLAEIKPEALEPTEASLEVLRAAPDRACVETIVAPAKPEAPPKKIIARKPPAVTPEHPKRRPLIRRAAVAPKIEVAPSKRVLRQPKAEKVIAPKKPKTKPAAKVAAGGKKRTCKSEFVVIAVVVRCK